MPPAFAPMDMNVDPDRLPRWGWMVAGLAAMAIVSNLLNVLVFHPLGLPVSYSSVTVIAAMAPVIIYVGVWYDDEKQPYWDNDRLHVLGDLAFVVLGTAVGAAIAFLVLTETGLAQLIRDLAAMSLGFVAGWLLFYVRNPNIYFQDLDETDG